MDNEYTFPLVDKLIRRNRELQGIARDMARRGQTGKQGEMLPDFISSDAHEWINANQYAFRQMIQQAHAQIH